jgi:hypothetical protein
MRWVFRLFGFPVIDLSCDEGEDGYDYGYDESLAGGETHNFERDTAPLNPDDRYDWEFGFRPPGGQT